MRRGSGLLLAIVGAALVVCVVTGQAVLFVRGWFAPVVAATGLVLLVGGWRWRRAHMDRSIVIFLVPIVAALALPASHVGAPVLSAAAGTPVAARLGDGPNLEQIGGGRTVSILDLRIAEQRVGALALSGRTVRVIGVADGSHLVRMVMVCCAADARPVALDVAHSALSHRQWVAVTGVLRAPAGRLVLDATTVHRVPVPSEPIL